MYAGYAELEQLPPSAYLDWQQFETPFDSYPSNVARAADYYNKGLTIGKNAIAFHLNVHSVWSADMRKPTGEVYFIDSYEGIGYHANTQHFLHGILDSGCPVFVHRWTDDNLLGDGTQIK